MDEGKAWRADELPPDLLGAFYSEDEDDEELNYDEGEHARGEIAAE